MVLFQQVRIDDHWIALPLFLLVLFGFFALGCADEEEAEQKKSPPIAAVKLPPAPEAAKEEPAKGETPPPLAETKEQSPSEAPPKEETPPPLEETKEQPPRGEETPPPPSLPTGAVSARLLNVRNAPNLMAEAIGVLPRGEQVQILGEEGDWYHIKAYAGYLDGWAAKDYITVSPIEESGAPSS